MVNESLYRKTVGILIDAYMNDDLNTMFFTSCAGGHIVAKSMGYTVFEDKTIEHRDYIYDTQEWFPVKSLFWVTKTGAIIRPLQASWAMYGEFGGVVENNEIFSDNWREGLEQIKSTGYSIGELQMIESASTLMKQGETKSEIMFNKLKAAIDALDIIHENTTIKIMSYDKNKTFHLHPVR